jgi:hypothetical protein
MHNRQKQGAPDPGSLPQADSHATAAEQRKRSSVEATPPAAVQPEKCPPPPGRPWETGVVPSSIPEQDLVATTPEPRVEAKPQAPKPKSRSVPKSKGKGKGKGKGKAARSALPVASTPKPQSRSRSASARPVKKQRVKSETESSDDEAGHIFHAKKEEEEETELADGDSMDMDDEEVAEPASRKRKRGKARANTKETKRVSRVSTRAGRNTEREDTRSVSSGTGTKVFAIWKQDGHYYSGVVHSLISGTKYLVKFDDGMQDDVDILHMRLNGLRTGDNVILGDGEKATVVENESEDIITVEFYSGVDLVQTNADISQIRIATRTISSQWKDRVLTTDTVTTVVGAKPLKITPSLSKVSLGSSTTARAGRGKALANVGIAVTLSPGHENWKATKQKLINSINAHGGTVIENWFSIIRMDGKYFEDKKRWVIRDKDVKWAGNRSLQRIFLLADDASQKSKYLIALALGIPCLSVEWLDDYIATVGIFISVHDHSDITSVAREGRQIGNHICCLRGVRSHWKHESLSSLIWTGVTARNISTRSWTTESPRRSSRAYLYCASVEISFPEKPNR